MTVFRLLSDLRKRDVRIEANGDRLRINAPCGVLTPEMRDALVMYKAELLKMFQQPSNLHFALTESVVLGEPIEEPCLVGCGSPVRFYWQQGTGYGYCLKCDTHQRIETKKQ
ncbi:MAG TPA: hypothetical protein VJ464_11570 [Blastocatellia bacterium]|nr:hypothetical protein [Blastocatellia bacterium]